ncbi:DNA ligase D [Reyranella sp.]|uniref:DNA ligase D n=1 Tax=Reyranella sp. TaxID=1929291 RepID=UPI003BAC494F
MAKPLDTYNAKRDFSRTPEPPGEAATTAGNSYVIQKHAARRMHYDFRLELDGVLKSWAVPEGPSLVAGKKRLAVETEDHPLAYGAFEGVIPEGQYGSGTVMIWDRGTWTPDFDPAFGYRKGHLKFHLDGAKLGGQWHLVRMKRKPREKHDSWLLFKSEDGAARPQEAPDILVERPNSAATGRSIEAIAREQDRQWSPGTGETTLPPKKKRRRKAVVDVSAIAKARAAALPGYIEPMLATATETAPSGTGWLHEIKHDGYRLQAHLEKGSVKLFSRQGLDWTERFPVIEHALSEVPAKVAIIDGEVVVQTATGVASFPMLVDALKTGGGDMQFYGFDLLYLDGYDLREAPLTARKAALETLLGGLGHRVRYSEHIAGDGAAVFRHASRLGLEGIISKRAGDPYRSGRSKGWLKVKASQSDPFIIAGFVPSTVDARAVGALVLGEYAGKALVPVGHCGSGFSAASARDLWQRLDPLRTRTPPLKDETAPPKGVRWVEPVLSAEIEYRGRTGGGLIRHAVFREITEDRRPGRSEAERRDPVATKGGKSQREGPSASRSALRSGRQEAALVARLTNPGRLLWPAQGITKQGLAEFHAGIAAWILPHVAGRPLSLLRHPEGVTHKGFFQKHAWAGLGDAVRRVAVPGDEQPMLVIDDLAGLLELVQASVLEIHPWGARAEAPDRPDHVTIDLDPGDNVPWQRVIDAAHDVRRRLAALNIESFVKTTGGKGLHVVFPLAPRDGWDRVKEFARSIATAMAADRPDLYTDTMSKSGRRGRIFVDYLRNGLGATAVGAYSPRAREGAPVSVPLAWDELGESIRSNHFTVLNLPNRLAFLDRDPWDGFLDLSQTLPGPPTGDRPDRATLAAHWKKVGPDALAHLARRPLDLRPLDDGARPPRAVRRVRVARGHRYWIDSIDGLLGLVDMGAVEIAPWIATVDDLERPDRLVFAIGDEGGGDDKKPGDGWARAVDTAQRLKRLLAEEGLEGWALLTGTPVLQVVVPIEPDLDAGEAHRYAKALAGRLPNERVDASLSAPGAAAIGAYSPRLRAGFPVAMPVEWPALAHLSPDSFTFGGVRARRRRS